MTQPLIGARPPSPTAAPSEPAASEESATIARLRLRPGASEDPTLAHGALLRAHFAEEDASSNAATDACTELRERALVGPLAEFLARPGKRFRARLVHVAWQLAGRTTPVPAELPCIIEALHAGSLIVDDIEDGSLERRGAPALHRSHGLPLALNAGNWLYFWPFTLLYRLELRPGTERALSRAMVRTLLACHEGQALDLAARITEIEQAAVPEVVRTTTRLKTGKLFELAAVLGATAAGAPTTLVQTLAEFGSALGCGLQMLNDAHGLGSGARSQPYEDLLDARPTWPWAWAAERLSPAEYAHLRELARRVVRREERPELAARELERVVGETARPTASRHLAGALARLRRALGPSTPVDELEAELARLEASYA